MTHSLRAPRAACAALAALALGASCAVAALPTPRPGPGAQDWTSFMSPAAPAMLAARGSEIWCATSAGLRGYDAQTQHWRSYFRANGLPADAVTALTLDDSARVWVGTAASDLARLSRTGDVEIVPQALLDLPAGGVTALAISGDSLWIASPLELGLLRLSQVQRITLTDPLARVQRGVRALLALKPGQAGATQSELFVAGDQGVIHLAGGTWSSASSGLPSGQPVIALTLAAGGVWAATASRVYRWSAGAWTQDDLAFTRITGLTGTATALYVADSLQVRGSDGTLNAPWALFGKPDGVTPRGVAATAAGDVYCGTDNGLASLCALCASPQAWRTLRAPGGRALRVADQSGTRIAFGAGDEPWISTKFGGIARFHSGTQDWRNYGKAEGLGDDDFYFGAFTARDGSLWFSNWGQGVVKVTPVADTFAFQLISPSAGGLTVPWAMGIGEDATGRMWFAHDNNPGDGSTYGLDIYQAPSTWQRAYTGNQPAMASDRVWAVTFDTSDRAWIGYRPGGVQVWDWHGTGEWKTVNLSKLGSQQDCYMILTDKSNAWLATAEGLARVSLNAVQFSGSSVQFYTTASGLPSSDVRALSFGPGNALYVGTAGGIAVMRSDGSGGYSVTETFTAENSGLISNRVFAMAWDPDKKAMWVAGPDGVSRYQPTTVPPDGGGTKVTTLAVRPNPARYGVTTAIRVVGFAGSATATIYSIDGRRVASRSVTSQSLTDVVTIWDGLDAGGARVPPGVYLARIAGASVEAKAVVSIAP